MSELSKVTSAERLTEVGVHAFFTVKMPFGTCYRITGFLLAQATRIVFLHGFMA